MAPFIVGLVLVIQLIVGVVLATVFRKLLTERNQKVIALTFYFILYELIFFCNRRTILDNKLF